jgi:hypothetical protein
VHASLSQYAHQLKSQSLRCVHDERRPLAEALKAQKETKRLEPEAPYNSAPTVSETQASAEPLAGAWARPGMSGLYASTGLSSKISSCARDLVNPCRKCGVVICRNCAAKPPSNVRLRDRLRRICKMCLDAPLDAHFQCFPVGEETTDGPPTSSGSSTRSDQSSSGSSMSASGLHNERFQHQDQPAFTSAAFGRGPCVCASRGVFLCGPCGSNLRAADTTYQRVFTWRSRYSTHIGGGLGTGLGLGNQGQKCGRGETCLDTSSEAVCWVEVDCSEDMGHEKGDLEGPSRVGTPDSSHNKPGYYQQEVVSQVRAPVMGRD